MSPVRQEHFEDCHYYEPEPDDFDGCPGPWPESSMCEPCPYNLKGGE